jgi:hypothetical protein
MRSRISIVLLFQMDAGQVQEGENFDQGNVSSIGATGKLMLAGIPAELDDFGGPGL